MISPSFDNQTVAVVIPCYKVLESIDTVLGSIDSTIDLIYIVDDACPQGSGKHVQAKWRDPRIKVLFHECNQGVGGATMTGYQAALGDGAKVIVKLDGDGQMDPVLIDRFVAPILEGKVDYTKGNRFYNIEDVASMPPTRLFGNTALSFFSKFSSGYWHLFDPTNGFTAISDVVAQQLPFDKIAQRYFFESDLLFRLNTLRAVVQDIPMQAKYENEVSNMSIWKEVPRFLLYHLRNVGKRFFYNYFLRNFCFASIELVLGTGLLLFALVFGVWNWVTHYQHATYASAGTVMLAALPAIIGVQMILGFINYDMTNIPTDPMQTRLKSVVRPCKGEEKQVNPSWEK